MCQPTHYQAIPENLPKWWSEYMDCFRQEYLTLLVTFMSVAEAEQMAANLAWAKAVQDGKQTRENLLKMDRQPTNLWWLPD